MKIRKTYCVYGLLEIHMVLNYNGATMNVPFTNGSTSAYGSAPATFTTDNPFTQIVIENSNEFKSGRISLYRKVVLEKDQEPKPMRAADAGTAEAEKNVVEVPAAASVKEIEVADKNEAIEYLKEHFDRGYTATALRTKSAFEAACAECGVRFVFTTEE